MVETLASFPLLQTLAADKACAYAVRCRFVNFDAGALIVDFDDQSTGVLFVLSGLVRIILRTPAGKEMILADLGAGEFFGEMAAIDGAPRSANVTAVEPAHLCLMPDQVFLDLVQSEAEIGLAIMQRLTARVRSMNMRLSEYAFMTTRERLCAELARLSRPRQAIKGQRIISPPPLHRHLADRIGTQREVVTRELARLKRQGVIETSRGGLVILDPKCLSDELS